MAKRTNKTDCENCEKAAATTYCQQCGILMCPKCTELHPMWGGFRGHKLLGINEVKVADSSVQVKQLPNCQKHPETEAKVYCKQCSEFICSDCTVCLHRNHDYDLAMDVFAAHKQELISRLKPLKDKLEQIQWAFEAFDTQAKAIEDQRNTVQAEICTEISKLQQCLDEKCKHLVALLDEQVQQKRKKLVIQLEHVGCTRKKMSSCLKYAESGLETWRVDDIVKMKGLVLERINEITTEFDPETIKPHVSADIEEIPGRELIGRICEACAEFDRIVDKQKQSSTSCSAAPVDPEQYSAEGDGIKTATIGWKTAVEIVPSKEEGKLGSKLDLTAQLVHTRTEEAIQCEVRQTNNRCLVVYVANHVGQHTLHIMLGKEHIQESPYSVDIFPSPEGSKTKVVRNIVNVYDANCMACNSKEDIIFGFSCREQYKVRAVTSAGEVIAECTLTAPANAIAVDNKDNVYVMTGNTIQKLSSKLVVLQKCELECEDYIGGICFNNNDQFLYVCCATETIHIFSEDLKPVRSFDIQKQEGEAVSIACSDSNRLYVTVQYKDAQKDCYSYFDKYELRIFTTAGKFVCNPIEHNYEFHVAFDSSGTIYKLGNLGASVYTSCGKYVTEFGEYDSDQDHTYNGNHN